MLTAAQPLGTELFVSNSEIATFRRCRRRWFTGYYLGLQVRPERVNAVSSARLGTRLHAPLEGMYGHGLDPLQVLRACYELANEEHPMAADDLRKEYDLARVILEGYLEWLAETGADSDLDFLSAEFVQTVQLEAVEGFTVYLQARLDAVCRRKSDGAFMFMDHKSVGNFDKLSMLPQNPQMRFYVLMQRLIAQVNGNAPQVQYGLFNMLKRSKRTARATGPFYHREPIPYNDAQVNATFLRVVSTVTEIISLRRQLDSYFAPGANRTDLQRTQIQQWLAPADPGDDCSWACPFSRECGLMDDGSRWEDALQGNFTQVTNPYEYLDHSLLEELRRKELV